MRVQTVELDLPALSAAFAARLREAGLPVGPDRAARFADAVAIARPIARTRLYWVARAVLVSDRTQVAAFDRVFFAVFGSRVGETDPKGEGGTETAPGEPALLDTRVVPHPEDQPPSPQPSDPMSTIDHPLRDRDAEPPEQDLPLGMLASDEEVTREKRFDALSAEELVALRGLMEQLSLATPRRLSRRVERRRRGNRVDLRRTLRASMRTGGDPIALARRQRRVVRRRLVLLCDISGSMAPYARAYLQFLVCAAGAGPRAEAFVFATRLTRITRSLQSPNPDRAIQRAAAAAPDWSSGTRIGDALKQFNDRHGRRGMARGAVIVILSDGWERGDPTVVGRELERLARLAHRIVWVNPRAAAAGFEPRAGGMAAALPFCDALVSGHNLASLRDVAEAIAAPRVRASLAPPAKPLTAGSDEQDEPWPSATPVPGSSVAMPSGYGPSRGRTTPGWGIGR